MSSSFLFDPTNLLTLPAMIFGNFRHADWKEAKRRGPIGVIKELALAASGFNTMAFFIPVGSRMSNGFEVGNPGGHWNQVRVRRLLAQYGVKSWGYGYFKGEMHFRVERRQMHWAQYVMRRAGVPLLHGALAGSRANPQPKAAADASTKTERRALRERLANWL